MGSGSGGNSILSEEEIDEALLETGYMLKLSDEQIDSILTETAKIALTTISEKGYHGIVGPKAKKIIDLGLAIFGKGSKVKAAFGPQ
jgi:hypothetical protein